MTDDAGDGRLALDRRALLRTVGAGALGATVASQPTAGAEATGRTVYVGTDAGTGPPSSLLAVDAETGARQWEFTDIGGVWASPTVDDGTVYVGTIDRPESVGDGVGYETLYAVDARTGELEWSTPQPDGGVHGSLTVVDSVVYACGLFGGLYAVDAATGETVWEYLGNRRDNRVDGAPQVVGGSVYMADWNGAVYSIDAATGEEEWQFTEAADRYFGSVTAFRGTVYAGNEDGTLYALDASSGDPLWTESVGVSLSSAPTVVEGTVYLSTPVGLQAFDAGTGERRWETTDVRADSASPTVADGSVYLFGNAGLYAVGADDGALEWEYAPNRGGYITTSQGTPTVESGTVYAGTSSGGFVAVSADAGQERWTLDLVDADSTGGVRSSPTVVTDPEDGRSVDSRVTLGTLGHHDVWADRAGPSVSVTAADGTVLYGLTDELELAVRNETESPLTGLTASASTDASVATVGEVEQFDSGQLDAGGTATLVVPVEVGTEFDGEDVEVELSVTADELDDPVTETVAVTVVSPLTVSVGTPPTVETVEPGTETPVDITVQTNAAEPLFDVELAVDLASLPGDWQVATPGADDGILQADTSRQPDGGAWTPPGEQPVWSIDELAPGETQRPGLTLAVPDDVPEGTVEPTLSVTVDSGRSSRTFSGVEAGGLEIDRTLFTYSVESPGGGFVPGESADVSVAFTAQETISNPSVTIDVSPLPSGFEVQPEGATVSDGGDVRLVDDELTVSWGGEFTTGDRLTAAIPVAVPTDPGEFSTIALGTRGAVDAAAPASSTRRPIADGGRRSQEQTFTVSISAYGLLQQDKRQLTDVVDDLAVPPGVEDVGRVTRVLDRIDNAVEEGAISEATGADALQRLYWGEVLAATTLDYLRLGSDTEESDETLLARRTARTVISSATALALIPLSLLRLVRRVLGGAAAFLPGSLRSTAKQVSRTVTDTFTSRTTSRSRSVAGTVAEETRDQFSNWAAGFSSELEAATEGFEEYLIRNVVQQSLTNPGLGGALDALLTEAEEEYTAGRVIGDQELAKLGFDVTLNRLRDSYGTAAVLAEDFGAPWFSDLARALDEISELPGDARTFLRSLFTALNTAGEGLDFVESFANIVIQVSDAIISFLGPFHAALVNFLNLGRLRGLAEDGIADVRAPGALQ